MLVLLGDFNLTLNSFFGTTSLQNVFLGIKWVILAEVHVFKRVLLLLAISLYKLIIIHLMLLGPRDADSVKLTYKKRASASVILYKKSISYIPTIIPFIDYLLMEYYKF